MYVHIQYMHIVRSNFLALNDELDCMIGKHKNESKVYFYRVSRSQLQPMDGIYGLGNIYMHIGINSN